MRSAQIPAEAKKSAQPTHSNTTEAEQALRKASRPTLKTYQSPNALARKGSE